MKSNLIGIRAEDIPKPVKTKVAAGTEAYEPIGAPSVYVDFDLDPRRDAERTPPVIRQDIVDAIYASYEEKRKREERPHRRYLGASDIGHDCARHVWYVWRNVKVRDFSGRLLRLFGRGHHEEEVVEADFKRIGIPISTASASGGQHAFTDETGHFRVHLDGIVELGGRTFAIEMKTMSRFSFAKLAKMGGVRYSHPNYYAQMMAQMKTAEGHVKFDAGLFLAVCKDNDELWVEEVPINPEVQARVQARAQNILAGVAPPPLDISEKSPPCRWCDFKDICRDNRTDLVEKNCRTCDFAETTMGGGWRCNAGEPFGTVCAKWATHRSF